MKKIFLLLFTSITIISISAQNGWPHIYHANENAVSQSFKETYDKGYLLSGWLDASYPNYCWLMKTDINGNTLWEKTIGSSQYTTVIHDITENNQGEIFIVGATYKEDQYGDPYVIKLNACGEIEWCNIMHTQMNLDYARDVVPNEDGGCAVGLYHRGFENDPDYDGEDIICVARINNQGFKTWETCYNSQDSLSGTESNRDLTQFMGDKLLITGDIYYTDTTTGLAWLNCYYILTNENGEFLWETIVHKDSAGYDNGSGGAAWESIVSPGEEYILSSISHYIGSSESRPAFIKLDFQGNVEVMDLISGYENGKLFSSKFINDSVFIGSAGWGNNPPEDPTLALKYDTSGNILDQRVVTNDDYLSYVEKTFDNKFLFFTTQSSSQGNYEAFLAKYNQNLEYDSIYNQPMEYDTLCPYPIASDTITLDGCILSTSSEENAPEPKTYSPELKVYPNPAGGPVTVELPGYIEKHSAQQGFQITQKDYQYHHDAVLHVVNIHGQTAATHPANGRETLILPTQGLTAGVYMVVLEVNDRRYASAKLMVR